jgi:hypothetical protein
MEFLFNRFKKLRPFFYYSRNWDDLDLGFGWCSMKEMIMGFLNARV